MDNSGQRATRRMCFCRLFVIVIVSEILKTYFVIVNNLLIAKII